MGYTTYFDGKISIDPPLNEEEVKYLHAFAGTRRMKRHNGPYFVGGSGYKGQGKDTDVVDHNCPPEGQPGLWCQWIPAATEVNEDGDPIAADGIEWDGGEKFYYSVEWMQYLIDHFLGTDPIAKKDNRHFDFLQGHTLNGVIDAEGEEPGDIWRIVVKDNVVIEQEATISYEDV